MNTADTSRRSPCTMVDRRERPPAWTLAEVRRTTEVMGSPPIRPDRMLPTPCAQSSRLGDEIRRYGSIRSAASRDSTVSMLATTARVAATDQRSGFVRAPTSGKANSWRRSLVEEIPEGAHGQIDEMLPLADVEGRREATESLVERDAEGHHGQRAGHRGEKGHAARSE